jgi:hypothetical protein
MLNCPSPAPRGPDPRTLVLAAYARRLRNLAERLDGDIPLLRRAVPEETFESQVLAGVERQARELAELAAGLWEIADLELKAPGGPEGRYPIDLRAQARRALRSLAELARDRRILVGDKLPDDLPRPSGHPHRIGWALEAALAGLIRLSSEDAFVTVEATGGEGHVEVVFSSDRAAALEGIGLDDLPVRLPSGPFPGDRNVQVLLDLAIARSIVVEHGGELRIDGARDEKGRLGKISIRLPIEPIPAAASAGGDPRA